MLPKVGKQEILTPNLGGHILACLIDAQRRKQRIVSVAPHYISGPDVKFDDGATFKGSPNLVGYIVVVEWTEEAVRFEQEAYERS